MTEGTQQIGHTDPVVTALGPELEETMGVIELLARDIGPRRPCSEAEKQAADALVAWLSERGVEARTEEFHGYASFGYPFGILFGASLAGGLLQRTRSASARRLGAALAAAAAGLATAEGDLRWTPISDALSTQPSVNVIGHIPSAEPTRRRVCLCGHLDTTRSGAVFHPSLIPYLAKLLQIPAFSALTLALGPLLLRAPIGRTVHRAALAGVAMALALMAERELRGEDVPGANDNASGCAVAMQLAAECAAAPLDHVELDLLITGGEEAGMLGAQAYARRHALRAAETIFINFDTVGGDVPLTYLRREGSATMNHPASKRLLGLLDDIARRRPDLGLISERATPGFPTDATPMRVRGWEAVTLLAQDGNRVPNYHRPTDTYENVEPGTVGRALETGRELLATLDAEVKRGQGSRRD